MSNTNYDTLPLEEMLRIAEAHTDPFVRAMARRLDSTQYQLSTYRDLLGMPREPHPQQFDPFKE